MKSKPISKSKQKSRLKNQLKTAPIDTVLVTDSLSEISIPTLRVETLNSFSSNSVKNAKRKSERAKW